MCEGKCVLSLRKSMIQRKPVIQFVSCTVYPRKYIFVFVHTCLYSKITLSTGQSPYNSPYRALNNVRQVEDTLHFYGSVNGSPIPILKAAPRLPRSPPRSPSR